MIEIKHVGQDLGTFTAQYASLLEQNLQLIAGHQHLSQQLDDIHHRADSLYQKKKQSAVSLTLARRMHKAIETVSILDNDDDNLLTSYEEKKTSICTLEKEIIADMLPDEKPVSIPVGKKLKTLLTKGSGIHKQLSKQKRFCDIGGGRIVMTSSSPLIQIPQNTIHDNDLSILSEQMNARSSLLQTNSSFCFDLRTEIAKYEALFQRLLT